MAEYGNEVAQAAELAFHSPTFLTRQRLGRRMGSFVARRITTPTACSTSAASSDRSSSRSQSRRSVSLIQDDNSAELFQRMGNATSVSVGGSHRKRKSRFFSSKEKPTSQQKKELQSPSLMSRLFGNKEEAPPNSPPRVPYQASFDGNQYFSKGQMLSVATPGRVIELEIPEIETTETELSHIANEEVRHLVSSLSRGSSFGISTVDQKERIAEHVRQIQAALSAESSKKRKQRRGDPSAARRAGEEKTEPVEFQPETVHGMHDGKEVVFVVLKVSDKQARKCNSRQIIEELVSHRGHPKVEHEVRIKTPPPLDANLSSAHSAIESIARKFSSEPPGVKRSLDGEECVDEVKVVDSVDPPANDYPGETRTEVSSEMHPAEAALRSLRSLSRDQSKVREEGRDDNRRGKVSEDPPMKEVAVKNVNLSIDQVKSDAFEVFWRRTMTSQDDDFAKEELISASSSRCRPPVTEVSFSTSIHDKHDETTSAARGEPPLPSATHEQLEEGTGQSEDKSFVDAENKASRNSQEFPETDLADDGFGVEQGTVDKHEQQVMLAYTGSRGDLVEAALPTSSQCIPPFDTQKQEACSQSDMDSSVAASKSIDSEESAGDQDCSSQQCLGEIAQNSSPVDKAEKRQVQLLPDLSHDLTMENDSDESPTLKPLSEVTVPHATARKSDETKDIPPLREIVVSSSSVPPEEMDSPVKEVEVDRPLASLSEEKPTDDAFFPPVAEITVEKTVSHNEMNTQAREVVEKTPAHELSVQSELEISDVQKQLDLEPVQTTCVKTSDTSALPMPPQSKPSPVCPDMSLEEKEKAGLNSVFVPLQVPETQEPAQHKEAIRNESPPIREVTVEAITSVRDDNCEVLEEIARITGLDTGESASAELPNDQDFDFRRRIDSKTETDSEREMSDNCSPSPRKLARAVSLTLSRERPSRNALSKAYRSLSPQRRTNPESLPTVLRSFSEGTLSDNAKKEEDVELLNPDTLSMLVDLLASKFSGTSSDESESFSLSEKHHSDNSMLSNASTADGKPPASVVVFENKTQSSRSRSPDEEIVFGVTDSSERGSSRAEDDEKIERSSDAGHSSSSGASSLSAGNEDSPVEPDSSTATPDMSLEEDDSPTETDSSADASNSLLVDHESDREETSDSSSDASSTVSGEKQIKFDGPLEHEEDRDRSDDSESLSIQGKELEFSGADLDAALKESSSEEDEHRHSPAWHEIMAQTQVQTQAESISEESDQNSLTKDETVEGGQLREVMVQIKSNQSKENHSVSTQPSVNDNAQRTLTETESPPSSSARDTTPESGSAHLTEVLSDWICEEVSDHHKKEVEEVMKKAASKDEVRNVLSCPEPSKPKNLWDVAEVRHPQTGTKSAADLTDALSDWIKASTSDPESKSLGQAANSIDAASNEVRNVFSCPEPVRDPFVGVSAVHDKGTAMHSAVDLTDALSDWIKASTSDLEQASTEQASTNCTAPRDEVGNGFSCPESEQVAETVAAPKDEVRNVLSCPESREIAKPESTQPHGNPAFGLTQALSDWLGFDSPQKAVKQPDATETKSTVDSKQQTGEDATQEASTIDTEKKVEGPENENGIDSKEDIVEEPHSTKGVVEDVELRNVLSCPEETREPQGVRSMQEENGPLPSRDSVEAIPNVLSCPEQRSPVTGLARRLGVARTSSLRSREISPLRRSLKTKSDEHGSDIHPELTKRVSWADQSVKSFDSPLQKRGEPGIHPFRIYTRPSQLQSVSEDRQGPDAFDRAVAMTPDAFDLAVRPTWASASPRFAIASPTSTETSSCVSEEGEGSDDRQDSREYSVEEDSESDTDAFDLLDGLLVDKSPSTTEEESTGQHESPGCVFFPWFSLR